MKILRIRERTPLNKGGLSKEWKAMQQGLGLILVCLVMLSLVAACGDTTNTPQAGAIATATSAPPATTVATTVTTALTDTTAPTTTSATTATTVPTNTASDTTFPTTAPVTTVATTATTEATSVPATTTSSSTTTVLPITTSAPTTTVPVKAPVTTTSSPPATPTSKASVPQSHVFSEKDNNTTLQIKVGDTLLAGFNASLDWNFQVAPAGSGLVGPTQASTPYEGIFKAQSSGTYTIHAFGKCHPVAGKACFNAITSYTITVVVR